MKKIVIKRSGDSWMVRQTYNANGTSWYKTTMCDNIGKAIITYFKFALNGKSR